MFNRVLNQVVNAYATFAMSKYRTYPAAKTAVVFVNVQRAFTASQQGIVHNLVRLQTLAREQGFRVVHAPFGSYLQLRFPSPAQIQLAQLIEAMPNGEEISQEFAPCSGDIVLDARPTLSSFMKTDLHDQLQNAEIEHILVAGPFANLAVDSTVRDGVQLGYHVTVLSDCVSTGSPAESNAVLVTMPRYAQTVIDLKKFESLL
jgi:nicotinamidase-related amidase